MTVHSLRPWTAEGVAVRDAGGALVCTCVTEADAKLIAQAPEMLNLLQYAVHPSSGKRTLDWNAAQLAIDRAEGTRG